MVTPTRVRFGKRLGCLVRLHSACVVSALHIMANVLGSTRELERKSSIAVLSRRFETKQLVAWICSELFLVCALPFARTRNLGFAGSISRSISNDGDAGSLSNLLPCRGGAKHKSSRHYCRLIPGFWHTQGTFDSLREYSPRTRFCSGLASGCFALSQISPLRFGFSLGKRRPSRRYRRSATICIPKLVGFGAVSVSGWLFTWEV